MKSFLPLLLLLLIVIVGFYFRTYKLAELYTFAHDNDLYSWIVKDIWVDRHFRLIGQETSVGAIFIGPLFYYLLVPFFVLFKLDPIGAVMLTTIIGILTIVSFYFVISKFFGRAAGLTVAFLYAVSLQNVFFDRWVVPTQPTVLWSIWYLYVLLSLLGGNLKVLPLAGILLGLIWHIHITLAPLVLLLPIAIILSHRKIKANQFILPAFFGLVLTLPFWLFEFRHGFTQFKGFFDSLSGYKDPAQGFYRFQKMFDLSAAPLLANLFPDLRFTNFSNLLPMIFLSLYCLLRKILSKKEFLLMLAWVLIAILSQFFSRRTVSEYYFSNIIVVTLPLAALFLTSFFRFRVGKVVLLSLLLGYLIFNRNNLLKRSTLPDGYLAKKQIVEYIRKDALAKGYPCISINYITNFGKGVGFRYFFWWQGVKLIQPGKGAPVYNIVIPAEISAKEINVAFGNLGLILPRPQVFKDKALCDDPGFQLLSPLGFVN